VEKSGRESRLYSRQTGDFFKLAPISIARRSRSIAQPSKSTSILLLKVSAGVPLAFNTGKENDKCGLNDRSTRNWKFVERISV
jgi:hypothetical protein